ncbi:MAG: MFS transporter [Oscillospiraceae bacterium]|nr:MFS transporter [Oscillospiraceae bacterium]
MNALAKKLWNRDFSLVVICQAIVLLCNMTLSYALAYFVLDVSGSAAMFGLALGLPYISLLIMAPLGGMMADRLKKQRVMFWLDVSAIAAIALYLVISGLTTVAIPIVIVKLMTLNAIQGAYMPTIQAAVPLLVPADKLATGNAAVGAVNMLANLGGLALAGVLYARFGLFPILLTCAALYIGTAIMDLFIRVPYQKQSSTGSIGQMVKADMSQAGRFMVKEKPIFIKFVAIMFMLLVTVAPVAMIGIPVLITGYLGMGMDMVGISQSIMMSGGLIGGIVAGALGSRLTITKLPLFLLFSIIAVLPIGLVSLVAMPAMLAFIVMTAASALVTLFQIMLTITLITYVQTETPTELRGKVLSLLTMLPFLATALGQSLFGVLFERFYAMPWVLVFGAAVLALLVAVYARGLTSSEKTVGVAGAADVIS